MESAMQAFAQFGLPSLILGVVLAGAAVAAKWLANNAIVPVVKASIEYMNHQADATTRNVESLEALSRLEQEIRLALNDLGEQHRDPDSTFSTVHTNTSLRLLARAVSRVAKACDADVDALIEEIENVLRDQER